MKVSDGCDAAGATGGFCDGGLCVLHTRLKVIGGGVAGPSAAVGRSVGVASGLQRVQDGSSIHLNPPDKTHANITMSHISGDTETWRAVTLRFTLELF